MQCVQLKSDFHDCYDQWFDLTGPVFHRDSSGGKTRPGMLRFLDSIGLKTPLYGLPGELLCLLCGGDAGIAGNRLVVVHEDVTAHHGEGKRLVSLAEALRKHPTAFTVEYIPSEADSYRVLAAGDLGFMLYYQSDDVWRSNCGNVDIQLISSFTENPQLLDPLWAIDFVQHKETGEQYAIDYNVAPQIKGMGIEHIFSAKAIAEAIKRKFFELHGEYGSTVVGCPFPYDCNARLSCAVLCGADICSNGYCYKMS